MHRVELPQMQSDSGSSAEIHHAARSIEYTMPTQPVLSESELRARVLQRIEDGRLPLALSAHIEAGYGTGIHCDLCDQRIAADKIEYDVSDPGSGRRLHFHYACHSAWQRECALRLRDAREEVGYQ